MTRRPIDARIEPGAGAADGGADAARADAARDAFAHWLTGVAVLAARDEPHTYAMTVGSLAPVSVEPPMLLVCVHNDAPLATVLEPGVACSVSVLDEAQKRAANVFADRFAVAGDLLEDLDGVPAVRGAPVVLIGTVDAVHDGGDHRIVVLALRRIRTAGGEGGPLAYWRREYRRLRVD